MDEAEHSGAPDGLNPVEIRAGLKRRRRGRVATGARGLNPFEIRAGLKPERRAVEPRG